MRIERLSRENAHLLSDALELYRSAFPREERRDDDEQERVFAKDDYRFGFIMEGDELLGIMLTWETEDFIFLEHFATKPELRNRGIGSEALGLLRGSGKTVILEIEPPTDEMKRRRYEFYKRNGFEMTPHYHIQAKLRRGDPDLELKVLSHPHAIGEAEYKRFKEYMDREIGVQQ